MSTEKKLSIDESIDVLCNLVEELKRKQSMMEKEIERLKPIADIEGLEQRLKCISRRTASMLIKDAVMSEVAYCDPSIAGRLWVLRDASDSFWMEREQWTINRWIEAIKDGLIDELLAELGTADEQAA